MGGNRIQWLGLPLVLAFCVVIARLGQLQLAHGHYYAGLQDQARYALQPEAQERGSILDRDGQPLAQDLPSFDLAVRVSELPESFHQKYLERLKPLYPQKRPGRPDPPPVSPEMRERERENARLFLLNEPWVLELARVTGRPAEELAQGLEEALNNVARRWSWPGDTQTILHAVDEGLWMQLRARHQAEEDEPSSARVKGAPPAFFDAEPTASAPFPGLACVYSTRRVYLNGPFLAHVLGTLGEMPEGGWDQLGKHGRFEHGLEERDAIWDRLKREIDPGSPLGRHLAQVTAYPPASLDWPSFREILERATPQQRLSLSYLGLNDPVRWAERPAKIVVNEAETLWLRQDRGAAARRLQDARLGESGVEAFWNQALRPKEGLRLGPRLARASGAFQDRFHLPAEPGQTLRLTISSAWQRACETALEKRGLPAAMVVLDCRSGEVLAMASFPDFDPNAFSPPRTDRARLAQVRTWLVDERRPLTNRCVAAYYPLGSVLKPFVAAVALEKGLIQPQTTYHDRGFFQLGTLKIHNDGRRAHGTVNVALALRVSSNPFFCWLAYRLGADGLAPWAWAAGLGRRTGIDLGEEKPGIYPYSNWREANQRRWTAGQDALLGIGQGSLAVTPLQAACLMACLANGGYAVTPRLWKDAPAAAPVHLGFSRRTLQAVAQGMDEVVNVGTPGARGTAYRTFHQSGPALPFRVAGKTGTADTGGAHEPHAWFGGYVPADHPRFAFAVVVEHGGHGGEVAAPIVYEVLREVFSGEE